MQCEFSCTTSSYLKNHMLKHRGENPFSCNKYNYKCACIGFLKQHMLKHNGQKPFSCNHCNYKCTVANDLKRHMLTHSGEKPYSCNECDFKCTAANNLKRHKFTHTHLNTLFPMTMIPQGKAPKKTPTVCRRSLLSRLLRILQLTFVLLTSNFH